MPNIPHTPQAITSTTFTGTEDSCPKIHCLQAGGKANIPQYSQAITTSPGTEDSCPTIHGLQAGGTPNIPHISWLVLPPLGQKTAAPQSMAYRPEVSQTCLISIGKYYLPWVRRQLPHNPRLTGWGYAKHTPRPLLPPLGQKTAAPQSMAYRLGVHTRYPIPPGQYYFPWDRKQSHNPRLTGWGTPNIPYTPRPLLPPLGQKTAAP